MFAVATLLLGLAHPAFALEVVVSPTIPASEEPALALGLRIHPSGDPSTTKGQITVSPFVAYTPAETQARRPSGADRDFQAPAFNKISAGISFTLPDQSSSLIVKQITMRAAGRQQTWPRRQPIAPEMAADHFVEAGLRFRF
jgi:hypothetical protein